MIMPPGVLRRESLSFQPRSITAELLGARGEEHLNRCVEAPFDRCVDIARLRPEASPPE